MRHENFSFRVIGRLGKTWRKIILTMIKLILVMWIPPQKIMESSRIPIPKDDNGGTRPIAIAHDIYCFILGIIANRLSEVCEKNMIFPRDLRAYRPGMSTNHITITSLCMTEDGLESKTLSGKINEDELKFYDRISLEVQGAAMLVQGFPGKGYIEFKIEAMINRKVKVITRLGNTDCEYKCGLMQGSPLSCIISNLVRIFKHRALRISPHEEIVNSMTESLTCIDDESPSLDVGYNFQIWDPRDPPLSIKSGSYGDDMELYSMGLSYENVKAFVSKIQKRIDMTGDLSLITKISRSGAKSNIMIYNVPPEAVDDIPNFSSTTWDFETDSIIEEKINVFCHFCQVKSCSNITAEQERKINDLSPSGYQRHLGVWRRMESPETEETARIQVNSFRTRITQMQRSNLSGKMIPIVLNSLLTPIISFAPLEAKISITKLNTLDKLMIQII